MSRTARRRIRATLLAAAVLLLVAGQSRAFTLLRVDHNPCSHAQNLFWPTRAASVDTSALQPPVFQGYTGQAMERWNAAVSTFHFQGGSGTFCDLGDGVASMGFARTACDGSAFGDAVSITIYRNTAGGEFLDADVVFSDAAAALSDPALFTQIAMHELGHVLGLGHSDACGASGHGTLMQAVTPLDEPRLDRPQPDDVAGAYTVYPRDNGVVVPPGANSCAISPHHVHGWSAVEIGLLPLLWVAYRRRRARTRF